MPAAGGFHNTGLAAGLNKGHVVTRFTGADGLNKKNSKPKHRKGVSGSDGGMRER
jgi:hypothetical protein